MEKMKKMPNVTIEELNEKYVSNVSAYSETDIIKFNSLRIDDDLFDEDKHLVHALVSIRRVNSRNGERWEFKEDNKLTFTLRADQLAEKDCAVLRTPEGIQCLMKCYKSSRYSIAAIKNSIRNISKARHGN